MADVFDCLKCGKPVSSNQKPCLDWIDCPLHLNKPKHDPVNAPRHYRAGDVYETIKVIEAWALGYNLGNCIKYISRAGSKGDHVEDLEKARWYLTREIDSLKVAKAIHDRSDSWSKENEV